MKAEQLNSDRLISGPRWILWLILAGAFILRLVQITQRGIIYDDAFSIFLSQQSLGSIVSGTAADTMPPLYYFLLHFWMMVSSSIGYIRLLNVILNLLTIGILYLMTKQLFGEQVGWWAAALTAVSPLQIYHSQDVRMYALLALTQTVYLFCFVNIYHTNPGKNRLGWWVGLVIAGTAALYTHNLAGFLLILPNAFLLFRREWGKFGQLILAQVTMVFLAIPWLVFVPGQVSKVQAAFWTPRPGVLEVVQLLLQNHVSLPSPTWLYPVALILALFALVLIVMNLFRRGIKDANLQFVLWVAFGLPALLFAISYLMRPVFLARGMLTASLMYNVLLGWFIARTGGLRFLRFLGAAVILLALVSLPSLYSFQKFPRSPIREAGVFLQQNLHPEDVVVHDNKLSLFPMVYYLPNIPQQFIMDVPGSFNDTYALASQQAIGLFPAKDLATAVGNADRVYFVVFEQAEIEYREMVASHHPSLSWLEQWYPQSQLFTFGDLHIYRFER